MSFKIASPRVSFEALSLGGEGGARAARLWQFMAGVVVGVALWPPGNPGGSLTRRPPGRHTPQTATGADAVDYFSCLEPPVDADANSVDFASNLSCLLSFNGNVSGLSSGSCAAAPVLTPP